MVKFIGSNGCLFQHLNNLQSFIYALDLFFFRTATKPMPKVGKARHLKTKLHPHLILLNLLLHGNHHQHHLWEELIQIHNMFGKEIWALNEVSTKNEKPG